MPTVPNSWEQCVRTCRTVLQAWSTVQFHCMDYQKPQKHFRWLTVSTLQKSAGRFLPSHIRLSCPQWVSHFLEKSVKHPLDSTSTSDQTVSEIVSFRLWVRLFQQSTNVYNQLYNCYKSVFVRERYEWTGTFGEAITTSPAPERAHRSPVIFETTLHCTRSALVLLWSVIKVEQTCY